jgi:AcrR family transcriptional regulator
MESGTVKDRMIRVKDQSLVQARQAQSVEAARRVFREKGFHPATVREIGAAASLTQGTLYSYARSKDDILFLVLDELVREYQEAVKAAIAREPDPRNKVRATIRAFTEVVSQRQDDILLLYQEVHALERTLASSDSSPTTRARSRRPGFTRPVAQRIPTAVGRSKAAPSLRRSAGARLTVIRSIGNSRPALRIAARTRSRLSRTVESGRPTVVKVGAAPPLWLSA